MSELFGAPLPRLQGHWGKGGLAEGRESHEDSGRPLPPASQRVNVQFNNGEHGFDNTDLDMKTIFRAVGPSFRRGLQVEPFESVHVYELLCKLLHIVPEANDGDPRALLPMLTPEHEGGPSTPSTTTHSGEAPPSPARSRPPWLQMGCLP